MVPFRPDPELIAFAKTRRGKITALIIAAFLTLIGFVCLLAGINEDHALNAAADAYTAAPVCTGTAPVSRTTTPCRLSAPMVVTSGWQEDYPGPHSHDYLTLRDGAGHVYTASLGHASRLWHVVNNGQTVQAEVWQGKVTHVLLGTLSQGTRDRPDTGVRNFFAWYTGFWLCVFVLLFIRSCIRVAQAE